MPLFVVGSNRHVKTQGQIIVPGISLCGVFAVLRKKYQFREPVVLSVFITILPVFLILGAGYFAGWSKYLPDAVADGLNAYALKIAVPVLLLMAMYRLDFSTAFHAGMLVGFYAGAISCFVIGIIFARIFWKRRPGESIAVGFCAFFSNTVLIGIPVAQLAFGDAILNPVFGIIAFHASLLYSIGMTSMELARRDGRRFGETLRAALYAITANPLMVGIVAGLLLNLGGLKIPVPAEQALDMIRLTAIPASLFGIGIALNRYAIKAELAESLMVSGLALIIHPAIAFVLAWWVFALPVIYVQAAVILAAMPPGMNIYIFATLYDRAVQLSASVLVIANILAVFTIPVWLLLIKDIG